jgi:hypothetical protein
VLLLLGASRIPALLRGPQRAVWTVLLGFLVGQWALFCILGEETFLYSATWLPMLIALAASSTLSPWPRSVRALAGVALAVTAVNTMATFHRSSDRITESCELIRSEAPPSPEDIQQAAEMVGLLDRVSTLAQTNVHDCSRATIELAPLAAETYERLVLAHRAFVSSGKDRWLIRTYGESIVRAAESLTALQQQCRYNPFLDELYRSIPLLGSGDSN